MIMLNFEYVVLTFFVFSGFLLTVNFYPLLKNKTNRIQILVKTSVYRYIRLMPLLIFFLLVDATWFYRFGSGILWKMLNYGERASCRKNWWKSLLLLNNYRNEEYVEFESMKSIESFKQPISFAVPHSHLVCRS
jgi:peptidoglycan/LPS O-acetylase OafA/YrhL